ncbi:isochorismatase family protein [Salicibibacter cibi]|uniref:isochorismatase n=1 Tax=Salicibibacter cibi TaxID=2743001 RepID=A0A7T7CGS3_9BACI|nr:isochorismatase family protein [Salicibibacter cibi]QQK81513.1 isochorismatase family protein [Salicibibacter cibi]
MGIPSISSYPMPLESDLPRNRVNWTFEPKRAILLVHDMQNYFLSAYDQQQPPIPALVQNIQTLKAASQGAGIPVVYTAQPGGQSSENRGLLQDFWGKGIPDDADQTSIMTGLAPEIEDIQLIKWRYSAFKKTRLYEYMQEEGRDQLIVTGIYAHIGCLLSASEAFMLDIKPFFVGDALADFSMEDHAFALQYATKRFAMTMSTDHLLNEIDKAKDTKCENENVGIVHKQVADILEENPEDVSECEDLFERGLDSVRLMSLVERWRSYNESVTFVKLAEEPTIKNWRLLVENHSKSSLPNQDYM